MAKRETHQWLSVADVAAMTSEQAWEALAQWALMLPLLVAKAKGTSKSDRLLNAKEAAVKLSQPLKVLYRKAHDYPFTVRNGGSLRFSDKGIDTWIARNSG